jgi:hypothetical protein
MLFQKFDSEKGVLHIKAKGNIDFWELLDIYKTIEAKKDLPDRLKILFETTFTKFDFKVERYKDISTILDGISAKYDILKEAMIVDDPDDLDLVELFENKLFYENYSFKIFKTKEAAQKWLDF